MKTVIVNGGPRKEWNTAQLLKSAQITVQQREQWWKAMLINLVIGMVIIGLLYFLFWNS